MNRTSSVLLIVAMVVVVGLVRLGTNEEQQDDSPLLRDGGDVSADDKDSQVLEEGAPAGPRGPAAGLPDKTPAEFVASVLDVTESEPAKSEREKIDDYREETIRSLLELLCSGKGGKRWPHDTPQAQGQFLLVHSIAVLLDDLGRGEIATGPYTAPDPDTGERVFSVNGIIYRFQSSEYPVWDRFITDFSDPETGDWLSLSPASPELPELDETLCLLLCERGGQALFILEKH